MLKNDTLVAIVAVHTAENEPLNVFWRWFLLIYSSPALRPARRLRRPRWRRRAPGPAAAPFPPRPAPRPATPPKFLLARLGGGRGDYHPQILRGSFSAVSTGTIARVGAFFRIFRDLQDLHSFAPLRPQNFRKKTRPKFCRNETFSFSFSFQQKSMNFVIFLLNFDEILSEFHEKFQEITKVLNILRNSARKIRKMLEISGICEKFHFFEWKFQWTP